VWLAPKGLADGSLSAPQVYAYDIATAETFRTTDPTTDTVRGPNARWSPSLHGFWLAYGSADAVVVENLDALERTTLTPAPLANSRVSLSYPWVAWTAAQAPSTPPPDGRAASDRPPERGPRDPELPALPPSVVLVADLTSGVVEARTAPGLTAFEPQVDGGTLAYTVRTQGPTGDERLQVFVDPLGGPPAPSPVTADGASTRGAALYDGLLGYLERRPDGTAGVRAVDLATGEPLGWLADSPDAPAFEAPLAAGPEVLAWPAGAAERARVILWWPRTGEMQTMAPPLTTPPRPGPLPAASWALGERTLLLPDGGSDGALLLTPLPAPTRAP